MHSRLPSTATRAARGDETPRRFTRGDQLVEILAVVAQWRTPDHRYFKVRTADETYTLRQGCDVGRVGADGVGAPRSQMTTAPSTARSEVECKGCPRTKVLTMGPAVQSRLGFRYVEQHRLNLDLAPGI